MHSESSPAGPQRPGEESSELYTASRPLLRRIDPNMTCWTAEANRACMNLCGGSLKSPTPWSATQSSRPAAALRSSAPGACLEVRRIEPCRGLRPARPWASGCTLRDCGRLVARRGECKTRSREGRLGCEPGTDMFAKRAHPGKRRAESVPDTNAITLMLYHL